MMKANIVLITDLMLMTAMIQCHYICLNCYKYVFFVCFWSDSPQWARASSFKKFLDHTQRRTTVGRTPLGE